MKNKQKEWHPANKSLKNKQKKQIKILIIMLITHFDWTN
jgi:hypothetical protein